MRPLVTTTHIDWAGSTWLLGCSWRADGEAARIDGVHVTGHAETRGLDAVLAAAETVSRQLGEGKRLEQLADLVEDDESAYAILVRAVACHQVEGADPVAYAMACRPARAPL